MSMLVRGPWLWRSPTLGSADMVAPLCPREARYRNLVLARIDAIAGSWVCLRFAREKPLGRPEWMHIWWLGGLWGNDRWLRSSQTMSNLHELSGAGRVGCKYMTISMHATHLCASILTTNSAYSRTYEISCVRGSGLCINHNDLLGLLTYIWNFMC